MAAGTRRRILATVMRKHNPPAQVRTTERVPGHADCDLVAAVVP